VQYAHSARRDPSTGFDFVPTLDNTSTLLCMGAGVITFVTPGEFTVTVP
jgi:hypothetical protein